MKCKTVQDWKVFFLICWISGFLPVFWRLTLHKAFWGSCSKERGFYSLRGWKVTLKVGSEIGVIGLISGDALVDGKWVGGCLLCGLLTLEFSTVGKFCRMHWQLSFVQFQGIIACFIEKYLMKIYWRSFFDFLPWHNALAIIISQLSLNLCAVSWH